MAKAQTAKPRSPLSPQALLGFFSIYGSVATQYVLHLSLAPKLGTTEYGYFAIVLNILTLASILLQFGFSKGIVKFIGEYTASGRKAELKGLLLSIPLLVLAITASLALVGFGLVQFFVSPSNPYHDLGLWLLILIPANTLLLLFQNIVRGYRLMGWAILPQGVILPLLVIAGVYFFPAAERGSVNAVIWLSVTSCFLMVVVLLRVLFLKDVRHFSGQRPVYEFKRWFTSAVPLWLNLVFQQLLQRGDVLLLAVFLPPAEVGIYALASRIAKASFLSNRAFAGFSASQISGYFNSNQRDKLQAVATSTSRLIFGTTALLTLLIIGFKQSIFGLLGPDFLQGQVSLTILLAGYLFSSVFASAMVTMEMCGEEKYVTRIMGITVAGTIMTLAIVLPGVGIEGAAMVTSVGLLFRSVWLSRAASKRLGIRSGIIG